MIADIIIPKNNEAEFVELAIKLGLKKIYFLYNFDESEEHKKFDLYNYEGIKIEAGLIVNQKNIIKASELSSFLVVKSSDKDRLFIEGKKIKLIYGFEEIYKKDYLHQRASGLNHTICELIKKNNVIVGLPYSALFNKSGQATALLLGRMMQNINLCEKYKVRTLIGSFSETPYDLRAPHDIISLFTQLGMNAKNIKESISCDL